MPVWDSDMASLLLLVYLQPPPPSGKKGAVKISIREAVDCVVKFHKSCRSLQEHQTSGGSPTSWQLGRQETASTNTTLRWIMCSFPARPGLPSQPLCVWCLL